jgi:hypothetical protein
MALYVVLKPKSGQVPPANTPTEADVYQGDFASEALAVQAAAEAWNLRRGQSVWVVAVTPLTGLTRYNTSLMLTVI